MIDKCGTNSDSINFRKENLPSYQSYHTRYNDSNEE